VDGLSAGETCAVDTTGVLPIPSAHDMAHKSAIETRLIFFLWFADVLSTPRRRQRSTPRSAIPFTAPYERHIPSGPLGANRQRSSRRAGEAPTLLYLDQQIL
jgi:hypothetical protein